MLIGPGTHLVTCYLNSKFDFRHNFINIDFNIIWIELIHQAEYQYTE